jgi:hypothetical protein
MISTNLTNRVVWPPRRRAAARAVAAALLLAFATPTAAVRGLPLASQSAKVATSRGWLGRPKAAQPGNLILVRNGLPDWGLPEEQYIGWADPDISEEGQMQVRSAARLLVESGFTIDVVHTSQVRRAAALGSPAPLARADAGSQGLRVLRVRRSRARARDRSGEAASPPHLIRRRHCLPVGSPARPPARPPPSLLRCFARAQMKRSIRTVWIILHELERIYLPVRRAARHAPRPPRPRDWRTQIESPIQRDATRGHATPRDATTRDATRCERAREPPAPQAFSHATALTIAAARHAPPSPSPPSPPPSPPPRRRFSRRSTRRGGSARGGAAR